MVIDASALVKAALSDNLADLGRLVLHAPTLIWSESASALNQLLWRSEVSANEARSSLVGILSQPLEIVPSSELVERASAIAKRLGWAKTYDAEYLALAERLNVPLLTADARLRAASLPGVTIVGPRDVA